MTTDTADKLHPARVLLARIATCEAWWTDADGARLMMELPTGYDRKYGYNWLFEKGAGCHQVGIFGWKTDVWPSCTPERPQFVTLGRHYPVKLRARLICDNALGNWADA